MAFTASKVNSSIIKLKKGTHTKYYRRAFGYLEEYNREPGDPVHIDDVSLLQGDYKTYFDCYKYGKNDQKVKLRFFYDRNGDGEYSGKEEMLGYSKKLDKKCVEYCHDLYKGDLRLKWKISKDYAEGEEEKRQYKEYYKKGVYGFESEKNYGKNKWQRRKIKQAYKDGEYGYGFKRVKKVDKYGEKSFTKKYYEKEYYKYQLDYGKVKLVSPYYEKVAVDEYEGYGSAGYGDAGDGYEYVKRKCKTSFVIKSKYLDNFADAIGFGG